MPGNYRGEIPECDRLIVTTDCVEAELHVQSFLSRSLSSLRKVREYPVSFKSGRLKLTLSSDRPFNKTLESLDAAQHTYEYFKSASWRPYIQQNGKLLRIWISSA